MIIAYIKNKLSLFNKPYPFYYYNLKRRFKISLLVSLFITFFLFIIKPFDTDISELRYNYFVTCSIYGVVSGFTFFFVFQLMVILFPTHFKEGNWVLKKELIVLIILLLFIGSVNFLIRNLINTVPDNFKIDYYLEEMVHTCLVGIFPVIFFTLLNYTYLLRTNNDRAVIANTFINQKQVATVSDIPSQVTIKSQSIYETISISVADICFIKSEGNYIEIFQNIKGEIKKHIIRNTLHDVERQLCDYPSIIKTHRSYLVNITKVASVKGNAQGYTLQMTNCNISVPVSRANISLFNSCINNHPS